MTQQINLYHDGLKRQRRWGPREAMWSFALVGGSCLAAVAGLHWHAARMADQTAQLQASVNERRQLWQALQDGRVPPPRPMPARPATASADGTERDALPPPAQLEQEVLRLRALESGQRRLRSLLDSGAAGRRDGYSGHLVALSRQAHPQVWITGLTLDMAGEPVELQGRLSDPAALPEWLRGLSRESAFEGRRFGQLQLRRVEPGSAGATDAEGSAAGGLPGGSSSPAGYAGAAVTAFTLRHGAGNLPPQDGRTAAAAAGATTALLRSAQAGPMADPRGGAR